MAKKVTLETIAKSINDLSEDLNGKIDNLSKKIEDEIDGLAVITKTEFEKVHKEFDNVHKEIKGLKQGQENIELRLCNVVYRYLNSA